MTTTERLMQLAEAWVEAAKEAARSEEIDTAAIYAMHVGLRCEAEAAFRSALSSTLEAPADVRGVAELVDAYTRAWRTWKESGFDIEVFKDVSHAEANLKASIHAHGTAQRAAGVEAERERCVRAADEIRLGWFNGDATTAYGQAYQQACRDVAASIRPDDGESK